MAKRVSILVVEDNRLVRDGIIAMLAEQPDLKVVAAVDRPPAALEKAREVKPEVVLLDAALGDHDSHRLVSAMKHAAPEVRIIVMDVLPVPEELHDFVNAGASGFIAKDATLDAFVSTVRSVASGTDILPPVLTSTLFSHIAKLALGRKPTEVAEAVRMTARERAVFDLIADGLSNKEIGQRLHLATNTVKGHVHNILEKLALHTRLQIAAYARSGGPMGPPYSPANRGIRAERRSDGSGPSHLDEPLPCRSVRSVAAGCISTAFSPRTRQRLLHSRCT